MSGVEFGLPRFTFASKGKLHSVEGQWELLPGAVFTFFNGQCTAAFLVATQEDAKIAAAQLSKKGLWGDNVTVGIKSPKLLSEVVEDAERQGTIQVIVAALAVDDFQTVQIEDVRRFVNMVRMHGPINPN